MSNKNNDLIVFDWDGTLMDSTATIVTCIQNSAADLGLTVPTREQAAYVIGLDLQRALQTALPDLEPRDYPRLIERYRYHYLMKDHHLVLFEGVQEMLADLASNGYVLAIATGKSRAGLNRALEVTGLGPVFDATRCADETFSKPHPAMLQELARDLGQDLMRTLMIGDTTHDLQMAINAGAKGVAVKYGAHSESELAALNPLFTAGSAVELHAWLRENG